jgi:hypothetical protein
MAMRIHTSQKRRPRPGRAMLSASDFTYLGAYRVPADGGIASQQAWYGKGLALRREASDGTNPVHLISTVKGDGGNVNNGVFEWRDREPSTEFGTVVTSYPQAAVVKTYNDVFSSKKVQHLGTEVDAEFGLGTDGRFGLYWDETDSRLYWLYGDTYNSHGADWCIGYSTLNYAANTGTGFGPWRFYDGASGQGFKSMCSGMVPVPAAYAASYLSGKRLAVGLGGYGSLVASGDTSLGPSLTAVEPPAGGATQHTDWPGAQTPLVGYWPYNDTPGAGRGRWSRFEDMTSFSYPTDNWPVGKYQWADNVGGAVWIDNATKYGVLFFGAYCRDINQYVESTVPAVHYGHYWSIYDPYQFAPAGGGNRYDVQPVHNYRYEYPTIDYTQGFYAGYATKAVTSITSDSGKTYDAVDGATVSCTSHGFIVGNNVRIKGASLAEYNAIWNVQSVPNANSFCLTNGNITSPTNWSGNAPTGTITAQKVEDFFDPVRGAAFDPVTNKLYVYVSVSYGVNNADGQVMVHVYQVAGG